MVAIGDQLAEEVEEEIVGAGVAGMPNLADVLEFIAGTLDEGALAQQQLVTIGEEVHAHMLAEIGDEDEALRDQELLG